MLKLFNLFAFLLLLFVPHLAYCQENTKKITVIDGETTQALEGVICKLYTAEGDLIDYLLSSKTGEIYIELDDTPAYLIFSYLGFENQTVQYPNLLALKEIRLTAKPIEMDEIVIKTQAITQVGDTINYSITPFKSKEDRYLKDVLAKLPGLTINANGGVSYQGKTINRFYMEGLDLLGNQYTIATTNLPIDAVQSIQLIENNQHIKALKDIEFSDKAAINIKFKADYKQKPFGELQAAIGESPFLVQSKAFATAINKNNQTLATIKTDHTGIAIERETREQLDYNDLFSFEPPPPLYLNKATIQQIPMDEKRYAFNKSYLATLNHLKKLSKDASIRFKLDATNNHQKQASYYVSDYDLMDGQLLSLKEERHLAIKTTRLGASTTYEKNSESTYVKNEIKTSVNWDTSREYLRSNDAVFHNKTRQTSAIVQHRFSYIFGKKDHNYTVDAFIKFINQPEHIYLASTRNTSEQAFDNQKIVNNHLLFKAQIAKIVPLYANPLTLKLAFYYNNDELKTQLNLQHIPDSIHPYQFLFHANTQLKQYTGAFTAHYTYYYKKGSISLVFPFIYQQHTVAQRNMWVNRNSGNFLFTPSLMLTYNINQMWKLNATVNYSESLSQLDQYFQGMTKTTYRNFNLYTDLPSRNKLMHYRIDFEHHNLVHALFFSCSVSYQPSSSTSLEVVDYRTDYTLTSRKKKQVKAGQFSIQGRVSKLATALKTTFALHSSFDYGKNNIGQQEIVFANYSNKWGLGFEVYNKMFNWLSIQYLASDTTFWESNVYRTTAKLHNITQQISLALVAIPYLQIKINGEHNYNVIDNSKSYQNFFIDVSASYTFNRTEFTLVAQNLVNNKEYSFTSYQGLNSSLLRIPIRGRSILIGATVRF